MKGLQVATPESAASLFPHRPTCRLRKLRFRPVSRPFATNRSLHQLSIGLKRPRTQDRSGSKQSPIGLTMAAFDETWPSARLDSRAIPLHLVLPWLPARASSHSAESNRSQPRTGPKRRAGLGQQKSRRKPDTRSQSLGRKDPICLAGSVQRRLRQEARTHPAAEETSALSWVA